MHSYVFLVPIVKSPTLYNRGKNKATDIQLDGENYFEVIRYRKCNQNKANRVQNEPRLNFQDF